MSDMTDKELLELAAKAAGLRHYGPKGGDGLWIGHANILEGRIGKPRWNPLTDDGDARRLAVRLRLECIYAPGDDGPATCQYWIGGDGFRQVTEAINGDPHAATRRAIVRAAAEIGKAMGVGNDRNA